MRVINNYMDQIRDFVENNVHWLNQIQVWHWQTKSYAEHEALGEYYNKFNALNDKLVETWQGKSDDEQRIIFTSEMYPNWRNYAGGVHIKKDVQNHLELIIIFDKWIKSIKDVSHIDIESIIEDMVAENNQLIYHLSLK